MQTQSNRIQNNLPGMRISFLLLLLGLLGGCGGRQPDCNDPATPSKVLEVVKITLTNNLLYHSSVSQPPVPKVPELAPEQIVRSFFAATSPVIENAVTTSTNKSLQSCYCQAELLLTLPGDLKAELYQELQQHPPADSTLLQSLRQPQFRRVIRYESQLSGVKKYNNINVYNLPELDLLLETYFTLSVAKYKKQAEKP